MYLLNKQITFPPVEEANKDGLLAMGGDLSTERLLEAYRRGIFPWYNEGEPICWWSPDPRCVLVPSELHISKSMQQVINRKQFIFKINHSFEKTIAGCRLTSRKGDPGTWIHDELVEAYCKLNKLGFAFSGEAWHNGLLVGGMYGIRIGNIFFGESMFSTVSNASKFAFIKFVQQLQADDVQLVDCQVRTDHLVSLGAKMISRAEFCSLLKKNI